MSTTKLTDGTLGSDASIGWTDTGADSDAYQSGFSDGDYLPAEFLNRWLYILTNQIEWNEERFVDNSGSANLLLQAPATEGGTLTVRGGTNTGTDQQGGHLLLEAGAGTGTGSGDVEIKASTASTTSSSANTPEVYIRADGANERVDSDKLLRARAQINLEESTPSDTGTADGDFWTRDGFPRVWNNSSLWVGGIAQHPLFSSLATGAGGTANQTLATIASGVLSDGATVRVKLFLRNTTLAGSGDLSLSLRLEGGTSGSITITDASHTSAITGDYTVFDVVFTVSAVGSSAVWAFSGQHANGTITQVANHSAALATDQTISVVARAAATSTLSSSVAIHQNLVEVFNV